MHFGKMVGAAVALLLYTLPVAAADTLQTIRDRGRILVAIDISHPPYGMLDDKAQETGSDVETAKLLAKDLGVKLEIVPVSGANRVPFLLSKKADIVIASFSITDERKRVINYSKPYGVIPVVIAAPASEKITQAADLAGKAIAVARGTTADIELTRLVKGLSGVNIVRYEDESTTNTAVATGQQKILAAALSTANSMKESNPDKKLEISLTMNDYPMAIGLRKDDPQLQEWIDKWVTDNLANGELNKIYKKYYGMDLPENIKG
jgi:polar amino acid transport system substrate-binding protein